MHLREGVVLRTEVVEHSETVGDVVRRDEIKVEQATTARARIEAPRPVAKQQDAAPLQPESKPAPGPVLSADADKPGAPPRSEPNQGDEGPNAGPAHRT